MNGLLGTQEILRYLVRALVVLIALPFHESAHALASHLLGDDTAVKAGRLSMNPMRHFDPLGALCMLVGGVGWAKPVGIDPRNYRRPKEGMALSAAAGPLSNLLLAWVSMLLYKILIYSGTLQKMPWAVNSFFVSMITMNLSLAAFNLLPAPPFDGSRIALLFLPTRVYFQIMRYERYIMLGVFALVLTGLLDGPLTVAVGGLWKLTYTLTSFVELGFGL